MTTRTHTVEKKNSKNNQEWSWEETPEFIDALRRLEVSTELVNSIKVPTLHVTNTSVPRKYAKGN